MAFLIDDILLAPVELPAWIVKKVMEKGEKNLTDESEVREQLLELQLKLERGDITEQEYEKKEAEIMEWLNWIKERKRRK